MSIKELIFGLWGALWVALDEVGQMLVKDFFKKTGVVILSALATVGWLFIIYGLLVVGWAVS
jgi:hypothetical protein